MVAEDMTGLLRLVGLTPNCEAIACAFAKSGPTPMGRKDCNNGKTTGFAAMKTQSILPSSKTARWLRRIRNLGALSGEPEPCGFSKEFLRLVEKAEQIAGRHHRF